jgi:hypothetical protein
MSVITVHDIDSVTQSIVRLVIHTSIIPGTSSDQIPLDHACSGLFSVGIASHILKNSATHFVADRFRMAARHWKVKIFS